MWIPGGLASFYDKISNGRRSRFVLSFDRNELLTYFFRQMKGNLSGISKTLYFFIIRIIQNFIIHTNKISFNQNNFHSRYILSNVTNFTLIHQFADAEGPGRVFSVMEFILKSLRLYQPLFPLWAFQWQFIAEILAGAWILPRDLSLKAKHFICWYCFAIFHASRAVSSHIRLLQIEKNITLVHFDVHS